MSVFISWSGERSKAIATALKGLMEKLIQSSDPWVSAKDIKAGDSWVGELKGALLAPEFAILCLVPENMDSHWMLFEAGAAWKALDENSVCPYLFGVEISDLQRPLAMFQAKKADKEGTRELLHAVNEKLGKRVSVANLDDLFDALWPKLEGQLADLPKPPTSGQRKSRSHADVLEDLVVTVRGLGFKIDQLIKPAPTPGDILKAFDISGGQTGYFIDAKGAMALDPELERKLRTLSKEAVAGIKGRSGGKRPKG